MVDAEGYILTDVCLTGVVKTHELNQAVLFYRFFKGDSRNPCWEEGCEKSIHLVCLRRRCLERKNTLMHLPMFLRDVFIKFAFDGTVIPDSEKNRSAQEIPCWRII